MAETWQERLSARHEKDTGMNKTVTTKWERDIPLKRLLDAGSKVLHERIAESYEPEWQELIRKMFVEMRKQEWKEFST